MSRHCQKMKINLINEVNTIGHNNFYLSDTMIEPNSGHITFNCGENIETFDEEKLLLNYNNSNLHDNVKNISGEINQLSGVNVSPVLRLQDALAAEKFPECGEIPKRTQLFQ